jgi:hypothetical protein
MALSPDDLAGMQATLTASLPDTCTLVVDTLTTDNAGGHTASPSSPVTVACRVSPLRLTRSSADAELLETGRVMPQSLWVITMPHGTTITPEHRVTHASRLFEVVEVLSPRSWDLDVRVSARLLNEGRG